MNAWAHTPSLCPCLSDGWRLPECKRLPHWRLRAPPQSDCEGARLTRTDGPPHFPQQRPIREGAHEAASEVPTFEELVAAGAPHERAGVRLVAGEVHLQGRRQHMGGGEHLSIQGQASTLTTPSLSHVTGAFLCNNVEDARAGWEWTRFLLLLFHPLAFAPFALLPFAPHPLLCTLLALGRDCCSPGARSSARAHSAPGRGRSLPERCTDTATATPGPGPPHSPAGSPARSWTCPPPPHSLLPVHPPCLGPGLCRGVRTLQGHWAALGGSAAPPGIPRAPPSRAHDSVFKKAGVAGAAGAVEGAPESTRDSASRDLRGLARAASCAVTLLGWSRASQPESMLLGSHCTQGRGTREKQGQVRSST